MEQFERIPFLKSLLRSPVKSCYHAKTYKEFSPLQRQAVIKLFEEKGKGKRLNKSWRPISLLNNDLIFFSKSRIKTKFCT